MKNRRKNPHPMRAIPNLYPIIKSPSSLYVKKSNLAQPGYGLFTTERIPRHRIIGSYPGMTISLTDFISKIQYSTPFLYLSDSWSGQKYVITPGTVECPYNPTPYNLIACVRQPVDKMEANCAFVAWIDKDITTTQAFLYTIEEIGEGEELYALSSNKCRLF